ncbi:uncharacterized protein Z518_05853 [Rhinocladiella mackenziei CBS 650.93]|uniref:Rhinocladiella mackenziei CBS 650.93 unplaced genomic scaffold supercont1.4, whole genome shotgun sequence n=1 Tax=Rhinocladiella mackenziei CBS 650.93 TaxID=1442369 RepID=A0A0D2IPA7_9EURO|nr:uncharacterized protein Z518_05853 [Rhinocladiella mackenziei CBS 650.93]KIX04981.1 hypothetical protein Z518_05853 [Rhinocladiella mackenziei CBS 650.93]
MASSAPHSPAPYRDADADSNASPSRPSPSKLLRIHQLSAERASSLPPRRLSSPSKNISQVRPRLNQYYTLDHAVSLFKSSKNIIVLTGAGISTSLGVPDFRSTSGIYNLLVDSTYDDPQELFHIDNFKSDPNEFFKQAAKVFPRMQGLVPADGDGRADSITTKSADTNLVPRYSLTHAFISVLQSKGKLLTNYTQNIDGLEAAAGVSSSKLIQCHGTLSTATCMSCGRKTTARKYMPVVRAGGIPFCKCSLVKDPKMEKETKEGGHSRSGKKKRKRWEFEDTDSSEAESNKIDFPKGLLKPDMTFFGEHISYSYAPRLEVDKSKVDLLVIIGTSLQVEPVNDMLLAIPPTVPQIWISKDRCQRQHVKVDIELLGECDLILEEIARRAGWDGALKERLWTGEKTPHTKELAEKTQTMQARQTVPKKEEERFPVKHEEDIFQTRPRSRDSPIKHPSEIIIQLNDQDLVQAAAVEAEVKIETKENISGPLNGHDTLLVPTQNTVPKATNAGADASKSTHTDSSPSNIIVELEEGTRSRWYIRRAK